MHISDFVRYIFQEALRLLDKEYPDVELVVAEQCIEDTSSYKTFRGMLNQCYNVESNPNVAEREQQKYRDTFLTSIVREASREVEKWKQSLVDDVFFELTNEVDKLVSRQYPDLAHDELKQMLSVSPTFVKARVSIRKDGWKKYQLATATQEAIDKYATDISNEIISAKKKNEVNQ